MPLAIPVCEGLRNGPHCLRCYLRVCKFFFPPFKCLFPGHASNCFRDQTYFRFTSWIPGILPQFLNLFLYINSQSRPGISLFNSDKVILLVQSLYADAIETVKALAALSASTPELISTLGDISFEARL
jgi:hypothetical protein